MEQKQVIVQNGEYFCDIDVTVEEWKAILTDEILMLSTYKNVLISFYTEPEHKSSCKALGEKYGKDPQHFNSVMMNFAKAVQKRINRFEVFGTDGKLTYWIIPMRGKYVENYFEWTLRPELAQAMEELGMTKIEDEYQKFKSLLEYFVAHLEWLTNNDKNGRGYSTYIEPLIKNNEFYKTGKAYNGDKIKNQVKKWSVYENGKICINIQYNQKAGYKAKTNYLNWETTGLNIIADWKNNSISSLVLVRYQWWHEPAKWIDLRENKSISKLGLFDNNEPNDNLKTFFDKFNSLIIEWNKDMQKEEDMKQIKAYIDLLECSKNLIFTGAPGTGKSYLAKQIAKQMIGVATDEELEKSEQFAFIQFHPSYDYTDFVEGLRPTKPDENGNVGFELKNGVFKDFCKKAREKASMTCLDDAIEIFKEECSDKTVKVKNKSGYEFSATYRGGKTFRVRSDKSEAEERQDFPANIESVKRLYQGIEEGIYNKTYVWGILEYLKNKCNVPEYQEDKSDKKYVFVIDEINRGEISKIFGELFFSIDPSYRGIKGAVITQYSNLHDDKREIFYVPKNVYIIGTMNDIDRSVESFDFAMRRRFTWEEITAEESAENMNLPKEIKDRMAKLNTKISEIDGLNASYHIGGAYFLDADGKARTDYETIWKFRLEPLLKEYLRGMSEVEKNLEDLKNAYDAEIDNGQ